MTENETPPNNDPAYLRQLFDSNQRLVGTLVNELEAARRDMAERDRLIADLDERLKDMARAVEFDAETYKLIGERFELLENILLAELDDRQEREAMMKLVQPGRVETQRRVRALLGIAKSIEGANRR